jgi:tetrahydromethanopterin S-methyltransferase subunit C
MNNIMSFPCLVFIVGLFLSGCSSAESKPMPYKSWFLGFSAPAYMEVWIETADAVDINERTFRGVGGGVVSIGYVLLGILN